MNKKKIIYEIISKSTLILPIITYLILSATILSIKYDYKVSGEIEFRDNYVVGLDNEVVYEGKVVYVDEFERYAIELKKGDIVKIGKEFYTYDTFKENDIEVLKIKEIKPFEIQKKQTWQLPVSIFFSLLGVVIVVLIALGKLKINKKYTKFAILLSLGIGTGVLFVIDMIVDSVFNVFLISFISYGVWLVEYYTYRHLDKETAREKTKSETLNKLNEILDRL